MSEGQPPEPRISADGKFYWNGSAWLPLSTPAPPPATPSYPWTAGPWGCFGVIALVVLLAAIALFIALIGPGQ